jgi:hypothetical protein
VSSNTTTKFGLATEHTFQSESMLFITPHAPEFPFTFSQHLAQLLSDGYASVQRSSKSGPIVHNTVGFFVYFWFVSVNDC